MDAKMCKEEGKRGREGEGTPNSSIAENIIFNRIKHLSASVIRWFELHTGAWRSHRAWTKRAEVGKKTEAEMKHNQSMVNKLKLIIDWRKMPAANYTDMYTVRSAAAAARIRGARYFPFGHVMYASAVCGAHATRLLSFAARPFRP